MKNYIEVGRHKRQIANNMNQDYFTKKEEKAIDKKLIEIYNNQVINKCNQLLENRNYTDLHYKPIEIAVISNISKNNTFCFEIAVTNKFINIYDKQYIEIELMHHTALLQYELQTISN